MRIVRPTTKRASAVCIQVADVGSAAENIRMFPDVAADTESHVTRLTA
jgi:hypothetical protein